jgi:hypothetical protein
MDDLFDDEMFDEELFGALVEAQAEAQVEVSLGLSGSSKRRGIIIGRDNRIYRDDEALMLLLARYIETRKSYYVN